MDNAEFSNTNYTISSSLSISSTPKSKSEATSKKQRVGKSVRDDFFTNITKNDKNWSAKCLICDDTVYDNIGAEVGKSSQKMPQVQVKSSQVKSDLTDLT
jgi:hypothetical protein